MIIAQSGARPVFVPASAPRGPSICHYHLEIGLVASSWPAHVSPVAGIFHSNYSGSLAPATIWSFWVGKRWWISPLVRGVSSPSSN